MRKFHVAAEYFRFHGYRDHWLITVAGEFLTHGLLLQAIDAMGEFEAQRNFGGTEAEILKDLWAEIRARGHWDEVPAYEEFSEEYQELTEE